MCHRRSDLLGAPALQEKGWDGFTDVVDRNKSVVRNDQGRAKRAPKHKEVSAITFGMKNDLQRDPRSFKGWTIAHVAGVLLGSNNKVVTLMRHNELCVPNPVRSWAVGDEKHLCPSCRWSLVSKTLDSKK